MLSIIALYCNCLARSERSESLELKRKLIASCTDGKVNAYNISITAIATIKILLLFLISCIKASAIDVAPITHKKRERLNIIERTKRINVMVLNKVIRLLTISFVNM
uniref:Uncharacterized protein n=1 Tax=Klebsiella sp. 4349 TaxID=1497839 RepID=A0A0P0YT61_9ENTR|nr:hypothetical protein [Klebsiella sp. 4349]